MASAVAAPGAVAAEQVEGTDASEVAAPLAAEELPLAALPEAEVTAEAIGPMAAAEATVTIDPEGVSLPTALKAALRARMAAAEPVAATENLYQMPLLRRS